MALLSLLSPLRWFRRRDRGWPRPIGRQPLVAQIRDAGMGALESAEKVPNLVDVASITNNFLHYNRRVMPRPALVRPDYSDTIER